MTGMLFVSYPFPPLCVVWERKQIVGENENNRVKHTYKNDDIPTTLTWVLT